jgi:hypothetical protein
MDKKDNRRNWQSSQQIYEEPRLEIPPGYFLNVNSAYLLVCNQVKGFIEKSEPKVKIDVDCKEQIKQGLKKHVTNIPLEAECKRIWAFNN